MSSMGGWQGELSLNCTYLAETHVKAFKDHVRRVWDAHVEVLLNPQATEITVRFDLEGEATGADMCAIREHLTALAAFMPIGTYVHTWWDGADDPTAAHEWFGPRLPEAC